MGKWWIIAALVVLLIGGGVAALVFTGAWPGPSAADRERAQTLFVQAETQLQSGDQDAGLQSLTESIDAAPQAGALRRRAEIYVGRGEFDAALRDMDELISQNAGLAEDYSMRCWLRARTDRLEAARRDCDRAIEYDSSLASAFGNRGLVGLKQGRNREAWNDFNTALSVGGGDEWVAWRLFGRGVAAWGQGAREVEARQDIERALRINPGVAQQFTQFGVAGDVVREFDDATYAAAVGNQSLLALQTYLVVYPQGAHAAEAQAQIAQVHQWIVEEQARGQSTLPGFSLGEERGPGAEDSFGAIAISRSTWRVAFVTDYPSPGEAERAGARVCNSGAVRDCEAFNFRNVCAGLAVSAPDRVRGMAWAYGQDDALRDALSFCRERGGRSCVPVHSACTPAPQNATPAASP